MDDLISRQAAIDAFDGVKVDEGWCTEYDIGYNDGIDLAVSKLSVLPSAQPKRKRGKWIDEAYDPFATISGRCSVCGWEAHLYEDDVVGMNYCPNCGARMDEFEEE